VNQRLFPSKDFILCMYIILRKVPSPSLGRNRAQVKKFWNIVLHTSVNCWSPQPQSNSSCVRVAASLKPCTLHLNPFAPVSHLSTRATVLNSNHCSEWILCQGEWLSSLQNTVIKLYWCALGRLFSHIQGSSSWVAKYLKGCVHSLARSTQS
jgi:hypothetical protein